MERLTAEDLLTLWPDQLWPQDACPDLDVFAAGVRDELRILCGHLRSTRWFALSPRND